tara:strand:- start:3578 stop:3940 length:363 start_codon:yes stop_codon:yes gene_type:complete
MNILLICLGASLGALARFYLSSLFPKSENTDIPLGILVVNILGCFLIGFFYNLINTDLEKIYTPLLFVGFLGAFTTFSAFTKETLELINTGNFLYAFLYVMISVFSCLLATWLGMHLTRT